MLACHAKAARDGGETYEAHCTSTIRRIEHEVWRIVQRRQTPPLTAAVMV